MESEMNEDNIQNSNGDDSSRNHTKKKIRRSDSNSSSSTQSQIMAMKQYERMGSGNNSSRSKTFSDDDSSDEDGEGTQKKKVSNGSKSKKRRRLTIDSDNSSDGDDDTTGSSKKLSSNKGVSSKHKKKVPTLKNDTTVYSDDVPKVAAVPKRKQGFDSSGAIFSKRNLKPVLKVGDKVYAAWWEDEKSRRTNSKSSWYEGRITAVKEVDKGDTYGPVRFYDIEYDDGECVLY